MNTSMAGVNKSIASWKSPEFRADCADFKFSLKNGIFWDLSNASVFAGSLVSCQKITQARLLFSKRSKLRQHCIRATVLEHQLPCHISNNWQKKSNLQLRKSPFLPPAICLVLTSRFRAALSPAKKQKWKISLHHGRIPQLMVFKRDSSQESEVIKKEKNLPLPSKKKKKKKYYSQL